MQMATLTVTRHSQADSQQRQVNVRLDGTHLGQVLYKQVLTREIEPGHHTLRFDNTWKKQTLEIDLAPGEDVLIEVVNRVSPFGWFLVAMFGVGPVNLEVRRVQAESGVRSRIA